MPPLHCRRDKPLPLDGGKGFGDGGGGVQACGLNLEANVRVKPISVSCGRVMHRVRSYLLPNRSIRIPPSPRGIVRRPNPNGVASYSEGLTDGSCRPTLVTGTPTSNPNGVAETTTQIHANPSSSRARVRQLAQLLRVLRDLTNLANYHGNRLRQINR